MGRSPNIQVEKSPRVEHAIYKMMQPTKNASAVTNCYVLLPAAAAWCFFLVLAASF